jgi:hypothetical protein
MGCLHCPQAQVREGACAIKVSMKNPFTRGEVFIYVEAGRTDQVGFIWLCVMMMISDADGQADDRMKVPFTCDSYHRAAKPSSSQRRRTRR